MEFFRNITAPELGVSPIGIDIQSVPNLGTHSLSDLMVKQPLIDSGYLNKIPRFPYLPPTDNGSGTGTDTPADVTPDVNTGSTDVASTPTDKTIEKAINYYYPQGSNTPVVTAGTPSTIVVESGIGLSKTLKTVLTIGGVAAVLYFLGVFKNSNVIK